MRIVGALVRVAILAAATCATSQLISHVRSDSTRHVTLRALDDVNVDDIYHQGKLDVLILNFDVDGKKVLRPFRKTGHACLVCSLLSKLSFARFQEVHLSNGGRTYVFTIVWL